MTPAAYLDRARALLPALRVRAPYAKQLRRLPDETFKEFEETGLFRALQPKRYGSYELDPGTFYQAVMDISNVCGSSAWSLGVVGVHNWQVVLCTSGVGGGVGRGHKSLTVNLLIAHRHRYPRYRRIPLARALVVLQWL